MEAQKFKLRPGQRQTVWQAKGTSNRLPVVTVSTDAYIFTDDGDEQPANDVQVFVNSDTSPIVLAAGSSVTVVAVQVDVVTDGGGYGATGDYLVELPSLVDPKG